MNNQYRTALVTGATSFVGCRLINRVLEDKMFQSIHCLVHTPENVDFLPEDPRIKQFFGDLRHRSEIMDAFTGVDVLLNIAPIFLAPHVVKLCHKTGIKRALFISSARKYSKLYTEQAHQIAECEKSIEQSDIDYIILRPTMIFGDPRERNITALIRYIKRYHIIPLPNRGMARVQPLLVDDLIDLIMNLLKQDEMGNRSYDIAGENSLTTYEMFSLISSEIATKSFLIRLPEWLTRNMVGIFSALPVSQRHVRQFLAFIEDRTVNISPAIEDLGFTPHDFATALNLYLQRKKRHQSLSPS